MNPVPGGPYADQDLVFKDFGIQLLDNAFEGYNVCMFAYGQTGSGKSYSIVGYPGNLGIIPRSCTEIFRRVDERENNPDNSVKHEIVLSMIEIYNEKVHDLLSPPASRPKDGLNIRMHPKIGVYVEGVNKVPVASYEEIEMQIEEGTKNRTIGSTNMNATSSRAHTVTTIGFKQIFLDKATGKKTNEKMSDINLIDLAGSERAGSTGATGDRLKEGANINKSLMILGKVISALAKKAEGKAAAPPFRESKLTFLLQNALGGNTKTSMIAALSPANINHDETLSTLRYAWQVKAIKNQAKVNEDPQDKLIRELRQELEALKKGGGGGPAGGSAAENKEMQEEMEKQKRLLEQMEREREEFESKLMEQQAKMEEQKREIELLKTTPHILNINADPTMTGMIKKAFSQGENVIGKQTKDFQPDVAISGVGIANRHCVVTFDTNTR